MPVEEIQVRRVLKARRQQVYLAWTQPDLLARWFFPGESWTCSVTADLRVGGRWEAVMKDEKGELHRQFGEYREVLPESRLVFTWSCPDLAVVDSVVTVELSELEHGTELTLTHALPPDPKVLRGHEQGWQGCLGNLDKMLGSAD